MQSAVPHVLATLDRTHDPERVPEAVSWARAAGFDEVSLDLIYGTPGESLGDWATSIDAALACEPDHVSAYALIVEAGHRAGPRGRPRRDRGARRRRHGRQVPARRRAAHRRRARLVRAVQLGSPARQQRAGTTSSTGPAPTGGGSARARTATSAACGGGTCGTRRRTPPAWPTARAPATRASCSTTRPAASSGCCSRPAWSAGLPVDVLDDGGPGRARGARRRGPGRRPARPGRPHAAAVGCSPTPSSAGCCPDPRHGQVVYWALRARAERSMTLILPRPSSTMRLGHETLQHLVDARSGAADQLGQQLLGQRDHDRARSRPRRRARRGRAAGGARDGRGRRTSPRPRGRTAPRPDGPAAASSSCWAPLLRSRRSRKVAAGRLRVRAASSATMLAERTGERPSSRESSPK